MKRFSFRKPFMALAMLAILLAFGLAFVSCDNDTTSSSGGGGGGQTSSNPVKGTWTGTFRNTNDYLNGQTITFAFEDTTYHLSTPIGFEQRGTYTYTGNTINGLATHQKTDSSSSWDAFTPPDPWTGTVSGNTFTANGETLTRVR